MSHVTHHSHASQCLLYINSVHRLYNITALDQLPPSSQVVHSTQQVSWSSSSSTYIGIASTSPSNTVDPDSISPSAPSSFLGSSAQSNATGSMSISKGKRKAESVASNTSSSKRTRPQSLTAQAQLEGSAAMQDIASAFKDISHSFDHGTTHPPETDLSSAVTLLGQHKELSLEDVVTLLDFFSQLQNLSYATVFRSLPTGAREIWLQQRLSEFRAAMQH